MELRSTLELPFELLESKLRPPRTNGRGIRRTALLEPLNRAGDVPIVMLCAGPGYGKTTALAMGPVTRGAAARLGLCRSA